LTNRSFEITSLATATETSPLLSADRTEGEVDNVEGYFVKSSLRQKITFGLKIALFVVLALTILTFVVLFFASDEVQETTLDVLDWLENLPTVTSSLTMVGIYTVVLIFMFPVTPLNLATGFLYGFWVGSSVSVVGCSMGATVAFVLGRTIAREWVKQKMVNRPKFKAIDWAIQRNGTFFVFLLRLSPLFPFPLINYGFGITTVTPLQYVIGTTLGVAPATIVYTYLGTLMRSLADMWTETGFNLDDPTSIIWLVAGAFVTILSIVVVSWVTQRAINKATREYEQHAAEEEV
jgi:uncharacterized membrane protein YdjX (TVP38/TMEM64 family)